MASRRAFTLPSTSFPTSIELNGDEALVWSYGVAHHKVAPGEQRDEIIAGVHYRDRCRRFAQGWLIVERSVANQWVDMGPAKRRS